MLTIKRTCTNKIITRVLAAGDQPFTAILPTDADDCIVTNDNHALQTELDRNPGAYIIYNQHPQARANLDTLKVDGQQVVFEVRQETPGVLGLQAHYYNSQDDDVLELVYQENT